MPLRGYESAVGLLVAGVSGDDRPEQGSHDARGGRTAEVPVRILSDPEQAFVEQVTGGRKRPPGQES
jgi:hypothetical protein